MVWKELLSANRIIIALLAITILMQINILYRQRQSTPVAADQIIQVPEGTFLDIAGMPIAGSSGVDVVLVEFSDFECPFCRRHFQGVRKELWTKFVSTGRLRYAFANNPLPSHSNAMFMATAAVCADRQSRFWEMHERLFVTEARSQAEISPLARDLGLDTTEFDQCLQDATQTEQISRDMEKAENLGIRGTPGFALGRLGPDGRLSVRDVFVGAKSFSQFESTLNKITTED